MRFKYTLQTVALSLGLGLTLFSLPARAQIGTRIDVNGSNYIPTSGTTISTTGIASAGYPVYVQNGGTLFGADNWTLSTSGLNGHAVRVIGTSSFSGTNLNITTTGSLAMGMNVSLSSTATLADSAIVTQGNSGYGISATNSSVSVLDVNISTSGSGAYGVSLTATSTFSGTNLDIKTTGVNAAAVNVVSGGSASLTGGTLTTTDATSAGLVVGGTATLSNVAVNVAGALVTASTGISTVTLDNVHGTNGANVFNTAGTGGTNTLNIKNSTLNGNLVNTGAATSSTVNLVSGTLTGAASKPTGNLYVNVDSASKWVVNASSTLTNLTNQGVVDMHGAPKQMTVTNFTQEAGASVAMTLSGTGGTANQLVNVNGQLTLDGALVLNGNAGAAANNPAGSGYFVLFNNTGAGTVSGGFSDIQLNGVDYGLIADGGTFTDANGYTYTLTYQGNAATGALTGGNDVLLHVVPEPGTWAMLVGGLGLLVAGQRLRRRSRG